MNACRYRIFTLVTMAGTLAAMAFGNADTLSLRGNFVVVDLRVASDVAAPLDSNEQVRARSLLGATVRFADGVTWTDGRTCEVRQDTATSVPAQVDPNLSDLQIVPGSTDIRRNWPFVIDCLGRSAGDVWRALAVDDRVLVARSGSSTVYLVLELPMAPEEGRRMKQGLLAAGFDPGPIDGPLDERARTAIAAYARAKGAKYRFATGIVTRNVLDALTALGSR